MKGREPLDHLARNRAAILERSAVAALVGLVPVPILDEVLGAAVRTTLLRLIADSRGVDADEAALGALTEVALHGMLPGAGYFAGSRLVLRPGRLRKLVAVFNAAGRADDLASTFAVATLFDHYCARHHVGVGLDGESGRRLARAIADAVADARLATARRGAARAARGASSALLAGPRAVLALAGALAERLRPLPLLPAPAPRPEDPEPVAPGEPSRTVRGGAARRALDGIADLLTDAGRSWVEELTRAFDERWARLAAGTGP